MSIVFDAIQHTQSLHAPRTALLSQAVRGRVPRGLLQRSGWTLAGLAVLAIAAPALLALRSAPSASPPADRPVPADIPFMAFVPPAAPARAVVPVAPGPAVPAPLPAATSAPAPRQIVALPAVAKFRPPSSLSAPLPGPTAAVPAGSLPGQVPAAPPLDGAPAFVNVAAVSSPAPAVPAPEPLRALSDLPPIPRETAERLRIGVHVYASQRRSRMLMVDGRPLREGDELADGLTLDEITQAGAVLRHGALRVAFPVASRSP